jgi:hypothetical protein
MLLEVGLSSELAELCTSCRDGDVVKVRAARPRQAQSLSPPMAEGSLPQACI